MLCVFAQYYLQPQHRVTLGNRRFGANGHISGGRQHAAPAASGSSSSSSKQKAKEKQHRDKSEHQAMSSKKAQREVSIRRSTWASACISCDAFCATSHLGIRLNIVRCLSCDACRVLNALAVVTVRIRCVHGLRIFTARPFILFASPVAYVFHCIYACKLHFGVNLKPCCMLQTKVSTKYFGCCSKLRMMRDWMAFKTRTTP